MKNKIRIFFCVSMMNICMLTACSDIPSVSEVDSMNKSTVVYFEGVAYSGIYEGKLSKAGQPNGKGTITAIDYAGNELEFRGSWKNGVLAGEVEVVLADQSVVQVEYKKNMAQDDAKRIWKDGRYALYDYKDGLPVGRIVYFDESENVVDIDRFYNNRSISEWCDLAKDVEYDQFFTEPEKYFRDPIKFSGVITDILDDDSSTNVVVQNENGQTVVGTYKNGETTTKHALVENLSIGEEVTVYGFYKSNTTLDLQSLYTSSNTLQLEDFVMDMREYIEISREVNNTVINNMALYSALPVMEMFSVETKKNELDYSQLDYTDYQKYDYDLLVRYPYHFSHFKIEDNAKVVQIMYDSENRKISMILQKGEEQLYYAQYTYKEKIEMPFVGQEISFTAVMKGNYKLKRSQWVGDENVVTYVLVPNLSLKTIE